MPTEGWFRPLADDRLEVLLSAEGYRLRASGPEEYVFALVECWEERTGLSVESVRGNWKRPPRTGSRPMAGQLSIGELSSHEPEPA